MADDGKGKIFVPGHIDKQAVSGKMTQRFHQDFENEERRLFMLGCTKGGTKEVTTDFISDAGACGITTDARKGQPVTLMTDDVVMFANHLVCHGRHYHGKNALVGKERLLDTGNVEHFRRLDGVSICLLYTSPSPRDRQKSRMPSSA